MDLVFSPPHHPSPEPPHPTRCKRQCEANVLRECCANSKRESMASFHLRCRVRHTTFVETWQNNFNGNTKVLFHLEDSLGGQPSFDDIPGTNCHENPYHRSFAASSLISRMIGDTRVWVNRQWCDGGVTGPVRRRVYYSYDESFSGFSFN